MERKKSLTPTQIWGEVLSYHPDFDPSKMEVLCDGLSPLRVIELEGGKGMVVGNGEGYLFDFENEEGFREKVQKIEGIHSRLTNLRKFPVRGDTGNPVLDEKKIPVILIVGDKKKQF